MESNQAISALEAKRHAEAAMARAASCPPWRHAVFGVLMGGLVASPAFELPIRFAILAVLLCVVPIIIQSDRKRTGMFVNGYRRGKTRVVTFAILFVELALYALAAYRALDQKDTTAPLLLGVLAMVIGAAGSVLWQRVFVREMAA